MKKVILAATIMMGSVFTAVAQVPTSVVDVAIGSKDHTTFVGVLKSANLVTTLQAKGPFTVFAPTNAAFEKLDKGELKELKGVLQELLKPEQSAMAALILKHHVVAGNLDAKTLMDTIKKSKGKNKGQVELTTLTGGKLIAYLEEGKVKLKDDTGRVATITTTDLKAKNGVVHVIDTVLLQGS